MKATLTYHSIDDTPSPISLSPETFAAHLQWLTSGRVRVLSLDDLVAHPIDGPDAVAVTFDDGFLNTRQPIEALVASGIPVTLFIVSGHVGGTNEWSSHGHAHIPQLPLLGWDDIARLASRGAAIGAHTRSHTDLRKVSSDTLNDELAGCRDELQARLDVGVNHVAYPYGELDDTVAACASRHFRWGHTTELRALQSAEDPLRLPRLDMYYFSAAGALESWGTTSFSRRLVWYRTRRALRTRIMGA
jgi:peptidoglycan/xylan/chitin deacetylase (PgdA/CDA1 family)